MSNWTNILRRAFVIGSVSLASFANTSFYASAADTLTIGSDAPALDVEHWVQDGNGKFKPVTKFENDKVYVVEFWATWCGPCVASMPHLAQLQKDFADKGVQIVSISDEDLETVEDFLEREVAAQKGENKDEEKDANEAKPQTYKELTSAYCLTTDPDRSSTQDYMRAAGQNGIPCAFIVGKDQKIEWIGHPMAMDDVLTSVVEGKWDRDTFAAEFKKQQEMNLLMGQIAAAMRSGKPQVALTKLEKVLETTEDPAMKKQLKLMQLQILMSDNNSPDQLAELLPQAYEDNAENPMLINMIAWTFYEKFDSGVFTSKDLVKASRAAAEKAAEQADDDSKAAILDTVAHLQYADGDAKAALTTQQKAVELADDDLKDQLKAFLDELKEEVEKGDK